MATGQRQTGSKAEDGDRVPTPGPCVDTEQQHGEPFKPEMPKLAERPAEARWPNVAIAGNTEQPVFKTGG